MVLYSDADRRLASCARTGDGAGVRAALQNGAGHYVAGQDGRLPLHAAAAAGHADVIMVLLQAGADLQTTSGMPRDDGGTALHLAAEGGRVEVLRLLASGGAHLDATDNKGRTAVHWAALRGEHDALVTLHTLGADLHALDRGQANALHFAVASGSLEAVRWMVEVGGVSATQLDFNRRSPYDLAKRKGHKHMLVHLKPNQQKSQRSASLRRQPSQQGPSAWVYKEDSPPSRPRSQHQVPAWSQHDQHTYPPRPHSQHEMPTWSQRQQGQHEVLSRSTSHQEASAFNHSQQNQHMVASRSHSQQSQPATWSYSQHASPSRQQNQRDTSAWVESQQQHQQEREEPRTALALLTQQNQDCRKKIAELEKREAELRQKSAADQQGLAELRKEVDRLTAILQSEVHEVEGNRQVTVLREEVRHLKFMLDDTGRRALLTQEAQQRMIESLRSQEEMNRRAMTELTRRLDLSDESNKAMLVEARGRERSEMLIRGEVDRLQLALASAPKAEAYAEMQIRAHRLSEQDAIHKQAILTLRRQLEAARAPAPAPAPAPATNMDQRRLREATLEAEKYKEEAATLSARLQETQSRAADAEKMATAYKRQLGECQQELREEREAGGKTVAALREELTDLKGRMEAVKKRAVSSLTRTTSLSSM